MTNDELPKLISEKRQNGELAEWYWTISDTDNEKLIEIMDYITYDDISSITNIGKERSISNLEKALKNIEDKQVCDKKLKEKFEILLKKLRENDSSKGM